MPHGEYLPWVQQACGLKATYASQLVKAAEWVNAAHERHLDQITDANTLFLLSADATPHDTRIALFLLLKKLPTCGIVGLLQRTQ